MILSRHICSGFAVLGVVVFQLSVVRADSLVTTSGQILVGKITKTSTGYTVRPPSGEAVQVDAADVKRVLFDHGEAPAETPGKGSNIPMSPIAGRGKADPRTLKILLEQGTAAFTQGAFTDARDSFADAMLVDPTNPAAGRGLGFSYLRLAKPIRAARPLEVAAAGAARLDRSLTLAIAASLVTSHNPMRGAKYIKTYFEAHPTPDDEQMLNALGSCLSQVDSSAMRGSLFKDCAKLYQKLNTQLETTQPGKKRWGTEWLDAADVDKKTADRQEAQSKADAAHAKAQSFDSQIASAKDQMSNIGLTGGSTAGRAARIQQLQRQISQLQDQQTEAQTDYDRTSAALAATPAQKFPTEIATDDVEMSAEPGATVVATAAKPDSPQLTSAPEKKPRPTNFGDTPAKENPPADTGETAAPATNAPAQKPPAADIHLTRYAAAFAVAPDLIVTASSVVVDATDINIETTSGVTMKADIVRTDQGLGLALLRVEGAHMPCLAAAPVMGTGALTAWGFPDVSLFNPMPKSMPCTAVAPRADVWSVHFEIPPRLPGGPVLHDGSIVGVELATRETDPAEVPTVPLASLKQFLADDAKPGTPATDPKSAIVQIVAER